MLPSRRFMHTKACTACKPNATNEHREQWKAMKHKTRFNTDISVKIHAIYCKLLLFRTFTTTTFTSVLPMLNRFSHDSVLCSVQHTCNVVARVRKMSMFSWWWDAFVCVPLWYVLPQWRLSFDLLFFFLSSFQPMSAIFLLICVLQPQFAARNLTNLKFKGASTIFIQREIYNGNSKKIKWK